MEDNQNKTSDQKKIKQNGKKPWSSRMNAEEQQREKLKQDQILFQKLPKYYQICHDNMSKNVLVYIDKTQLKYKFNTNQNNVSEEIKELDRRILLLKNQLENEKQTKENDGLGFITQPKTKEQKQKIRVQQARTFYKSNSIQQGIEELQEFIRKKKLLSITSDNNTIQKKGRPKDQLDHLKRVITKENTPIVPLLACNSFKPKKPSQMNQIEAYLNEYKPFVTGQVGIVPRKLQEINLQMTNATSNEIKKKNIDLVVKNTSYN